MLNPVLERLATNIFREPYASDGKIDGVFSHARKMAKSIALTKPVIQINGPRRIQYLCFDIDREFGGIAWDDANLPPPNLIINNPVNGHAHLVYELQVPIWMRRPDDYRHEEALPVRYLKAVQKAMGRVLVADSGYTGLMVKNPFHASWAVSSARERPYTLTELSEHLDLDVSCTQPEAILREAEGRRATLFDSIRYWAYRQKSNYATLAAFHDDIWNELERLNTTFDKGPEPYHTIKSIAKSVSRWVWNRYDCKRRGIMGLDASEPIKVRQQKGQEFTCRVRCKKTLSCIRDSVTRLIDRGVKLTKTSVATESGFSRNTIRVYWQFLQDLLLPVTHETGCFQHKSSLGPYGARTEGYPDSDPSSRYRRQSELTSPTILQNGGVAPVNMSMPEQFKKWGICSCDPSLPFTERARVGQRYTTVLRNNATRAGIRDAIVELEKIGAAVTKSAVARYLGITRNTVRAHWDKLGDSVEMMTTEMPDEHWLGNRAKQRYERLVRYRAKGIPLDTRLAENLRKRLRDVLNGKIKSGSAINDLGCSMEHLRRHFEAKFQPGMSWDNYGDWEIDHIIPLASFDLTDRSQLTNACHFTNLQPLWKHDNRRKSCIIGSENEERTNQRTT